MAKKTPTIPPATITIPYDTYEELRKKAYKADHKGNKLHTYLKSLELDGFFTIDFISVPGLTVGFKKGVFTLVNNNGDITIDLNDLKHLCNELPSLTAHADGVAS